MAKGKKTGGRTAGTPNQVSATMKASVLAVYAKIGGDANFAAWATENQTEFYKIASKLLPSDLKASVDVDGEIVIRWKS